MQRCTGDRNSVLPYGKRRLQIVEQFELKIIAYLTGDRSGRDAPQHPTW